MKMLELLFPVSLLQSNYYNHIARKDKYQFKILFVRGVHHDFTKTIIN